jgi:endonuclease-3
MRAPEQLGRALALLDQTYGRPVWSPRLPPVDELVYTVLSQNTADVNTERTFAVLKAIALGGLAHVKAPRIKAILAAVSVRTGDPDLSELDGMTDAAALAYLQTLPGVGPKTAACVLMFALGRPAMPVDTHVHRVAGRLGLIDAKLSAEQAHRPLTELAGAENVYALHINLVLHGRRLCHARRPECGRCPLEVICPSAGLFS